MLLVVTHLSRAPHVSIAVAGVEPAQGRFFRLRNPSARLAPTLLGRHGGPLALGNLLEVSLSTIDTGPPYVEDHAFDPAGVRAVDRLAPDRFWALLDRLAQTTLEGLFGPTLRRVGRGGCGVDPGQGTASLGCLRPGRSDLGCEVRDMRLQARMQLSDGRFDADVPVKDVRLHRDDFLTPLESRVEAVRRRLASGEDHLLSVALSERHQTSTEPPGVHWLEVDNIHFRQDPYWEPGP